MRTNIETDDQLMQKAMAASGQPTKKATVEATLDLLIATWCLEHDMTLLHNDRDFHLMTRHLGLREA